MPSSFRGAVLDLGSNTFKLLLAEQRGDTLIVRREIALPARLSASLDLTGKLSAAAIRRSLQALRRCRREITRFGATRLVAVGTSALRSAANRQQFLQPAKKILGTSIRILSGKQESQLIYAAIAATTPRAKKILILDIGGGSTEFAYGTPKQLRVARSIPIGCVRLRDRFLSHHPPDPLDLQRAQAYILRRLKPHLRHSRGVLLASGGTLHALCSLQEPRTPNHRLHGKILKTAALQRAIARLASLPLAQLKKLPGMPPHRADILLPGALILLTALQLLRKTSVAYAAHGLRYGVWAQYLRPYTKTCFKS